MNATLSEDAREQRINQLQRNYEEFLQTVSLSADDTHRLTFSKKSYGQNNAALGSRIETMEILTAGIRRLFPNIASSFLIEAMIVTSVGDLFEQYIDRTSLNLDDNLDIPNIYLLLDVEEVSSAAEKLYQQLESTSDLKLVIIPLMGVTINDPNLAAEITLGNCTLQMNHDFAMQHLLGDSYPTLTEAHREILSKADCLLTVTVAGDSDFAEEWAYKMAFPIVHVLNFYLADCESRAVGNRKISLAGHSSTADVQLVLITRNESKSLVGHHWSAREFMNYEISTRQIDTWKSHGLGRILLSFSERIDPNSMNARIRNAITWYSKAINSDGLEEQFVGLTTSLESLLVGNDGTNPNSSTASISQKLAERVAFLLETEPDSRIELARQTKDLYGLRSKIVHAGQIVSGENLIRLNRVVRSSIHSLIDLDLETWNQFTDWENHQKYSTPADTTTHA